MQKMDTRKKIEHDTYRTFLTTQIECILRTNLPADQDYESKY